CHRLVAPRAHRLARAGRAAAIFDVHAVVLSELVHRGAEDRRRGDAEAAERELLHVIAELAKPFRIFVASELALHALEDPLHSRRADAARHADAAGLLREVREELRGLGDDARALRYRPDLRRAHMRPRRAQLVEVEARPPAHRRQDPSGRPADVDALELADDTTRPVDDLRERRAERD